MRGMSKPDTKAMRRRLSKAYLTSVVSITLVLLLIGVASLIIINSRSVVKYLKESMKVSVLFVQSADERDAEKYIETLSALSYVKEANLVSREEGERELAKMLGEDFLSVFQTSPVPVSVDITLNSEYVVLDSLEFISQVFAASPLVETVDSNQSMVKLLNENLTKLSMIFGVFILLLLFISSVLINNMVRLSVFARRFTIHTMRLVGATKSFIRAPFLKRALFQGLLSAFVASGILVCLYYLAYNSFSELFEIFTHRSLAEALGIMFVVGVLICVTSTYFVVGHLVSVNKDDLYY